MYNQFYVTLMSNDSMNKYPKNVLSSFTNYIECPFLLAGEWEVGISEMYYNRFRFLSIQNLPEDNVDCKKVGLRLQECADWSEDKVIEFMYIHTDIIKPRAVGSQMVRCLKVMPADAKKDDYVKFGRIEYYPVETSYIRSISILILDSESSQIRFEQSLLPTLITLHFKRKSI